MTYLVITEETTSECNSCCCKQMAGSPGEVYQWDLDYAAWSVPIGGKGISEVVAEVELLRAARIPDGVPVANNGSVTGAFNTEIQGALASIVTYDGDESLTYKALPFSGPKNGKVVLDANTGEFVYTPTNGWSGWDSFYYSVTSPKGATIAEMRIGVSPQVGTLPPVKYTPPVSIPDSRISLVKTYHLVKTAVVISPGARIGDVYRVTYRAVALDCDCNEFVNLSCFDLTIGKC